MTIPPGQQFWVLIFLCVLLYSVWELLRTWRAVFWRRTEGEVIKAFVVHTPSSLSPIIRGMPKVSGWSPVVVCSINGEEVSATPSLSKPSYRSEAVARRLAAANAAGRKVAVWINPGESEEGVLNPAPLALWFETVVYGAFVGWVVYTLVSNGLTWS